MRKIDTGRLGEEKAVAYLLKSGYKIMARNFKNYLGEIDIVACDKDVICFIEVRTRRAAASGTPAIPIKAGCSAASGTPAIPIKAGCSAASGTLCHENALSSVNFAKQRRLSRLALSFLKEKKLLERRARFDVVSVSLGDTVSDIFLLKDAFPVVANYG
ncbi:MAG: YraN family protein [Candidatus Omnitrophica bacterium]|nr:YraN family protein [Candidatus Omnitrophota bacterium]